jgi:hypothetical protein
MIYLGTTNINKIYKGTEELNKIFLGSDLVWYSYRDYSLEYLTFEIVTAGSIGIKTYGAFGSKTIEYSINNGTWTSISSPATAGGTTSIPNLQVGDKVRVRGNNTNYATSNAIYFGFEGGSSTYNLYGNIMSLCYGDNFVGNNTLPATYTFCSLFKLAPVISAENLVLPADVLTEGCYRALFSKSTLRIAPKVLPARTLAKHCYWYMFEECFFEKCPILPATGAVSANGYGNMFTGCSNANWIMCLATNVSATDATTNWVKTVAANGTFIKNPNMSSWTSGINGIPSNWTVVDFTYDIQYLTIDVLTSGTISIINEGNISKNIQYSINYQPWKNYTSDINVVTNDSIRFRGNNRGYSTSDNDYVHFGGTATFNVVGNIMSLISSDEFTNNIILVDNSNFYKLFGSSNVISAGNLVLPTLDLTEYCYQQMFNGCTSLTTAPELPATTLIEGCYQQMFNGCTSLTTAPELLSLTLEKNCYKEMFSGCSLLNYVKCTATDISAEDSTNNWLLNVASSGTFATNLSTNWVVNSPSGIPTGWTLQPA